MNNKSRRVETRIPGELYKRLEAEAKKRDVPVSHLIRVFVQRGLNKK